MNTVGSNGFEGAWRRFSSVYFLLMAASVWGVEFETPLALTHATLVAEPGQVITDATIVIQQGRIAALGASVVVPADAQVIDATGLWAYAGFIDACSHMGISNDPPSEQQMARWADQEADVTQAPRTNMQRANRKGIWPHRTIADLYVASDDVFEDYRKAGFTTALVSPHPAILGGAPAVLELSGVPLRRATVQSGAMQIVAYGQGLPSRLPGNDSSYPRSVMAVVAMLRQVYMDAEGYGHRQALFETHPQEVQRPPFDPVLDAMGDLIAGKKKWLFKADAAWEIQHALDLAEEFKQSIVILGGKEAWKVVDRLAAKNIPVIVSPDWGEKPKLVAKEAKDDGDKTPNAHRLTTLSWSPEWEDDFFEPAAVRRERIRQWEEQVNNIHTLMEAGVPVALTGRDVNSPGKLWKNLRTAMEHGLAADQVLQALTTSAALILGVSDQMGSLAAGKLANITLLTGPIKDKESRPRYTFVEGQRFAMNVPDSDEDEDEDEKEAENETDESDETETEGEPNGRHEWAVELDEDRQPPMHTGGSLLVKNATVLTVTGAALKDHDILIEAGRIKQVAPHIAPPRDTTVIDLSGYWVMPGIIDAHSHMAIRGGVNEGTQSITCEVRIADVIDDTRLQLHRALAGGVTTIHAMHGSANTIGGQNAVLKLKYKTSPRNALVAHGPRTVKFALGENPKRNTSRFPNSRMGVESVLRHAFNEAIAYRDAWDAWRDKQQAGEVAHRPRRDLRLETLNEILQGHIWVQSHCYRADEILRLLTVAEDYGFRIATLHHVLEGYRVLPEMLRHGVAGSTFSDWWAYKIEAYDAIPYNAAMMAQAGVVASVNSDSADVVRYLNLEAAKTMRFGGLSENQALRLITINPARQIGLADRIGSIEVGKDGDLAVFDRHPLDTFSRCMLTVVEGEIFFAHPSFDPHNPAPGPHSTFVPDPPRSLLQIDTNPHRRYAIVGAVVHPVSSAPIDKGVVLVDNGLITSVGRDLQLPADATVIDAAGLHVYPGLINSATQLGLTEIDSVAGTDDLRESASFQPEIHAVSAVNAHSAHIDVARCEGITTAAVFPAGGVISGQAGWVQLTGWSMPEMLRNEAIGLVIDLPSLPALLDEGERSERIENHRQEIERIETYIKQAQHYARLKQYDSVSLPRDLRLEAMVPYVQGEKPVFFRANTYKEILEAISFSETFGLQPVIVGAADAWKCSDQLAKKNIPVIITSILQYPGSQFERFDAYFGNAGLLEKAGVRFSIAADGAPYAKRLPVLAGMAVAHGLSKERAIRAITLDAAKILQVAGAVGSLEPGKTADLIITTGNPCQANTRTVACLLKGDPVQLESRHERHYRKFSNRPEPHLPPIRLLRGPQPMHIDIH